MLNLTLKSVRGHLLRFLLTAVSVTLGVALVAGTYVFTDSINKTFDDLFASAGQAVDVQVRGDKGGTTVDGTELRTPLPLSLQSRLRSVDGVARVGPDIQGVALLVGKDGTAVRNGGAPTFGFAYLPDDPTLSLVKGTAPRGPAQIGVESSTLKRSGLAVGDRTRALIGGEPRAVTVTGEIKFDAGLAGATIVVLDEPSARAVFSPDGTVQSFTVTAAEGVSQEALRDRVAATLPAGAEAVTGETFTQEGRDMIEEILGFFNIFLLIFAGISLFVGGFIIANTFSMLVAQRTRELALLRAVGASRGQVLRVVLGEAVVVGIAGSVLGIGVGVAIAALLRFLIGLIGLEITGTLPLLPRTIIVSLLVGTVVTTVSAVLPAVRAARIAPVAALRDDVALPESRVRWRGIAGTLALAAGVAVLLPSVLRDEVIWPLVGVGSGLIVIGALLAAPLVAHPLIRVLALPFVGLGGTVGRLARENALRNPRRTATTASALMIGLAIISSVSVFAQSTKASVSDIVEKRLSADFVLNGGGQAQFPTAVAERAQAVPGVQSVASISGLPVTLDGNSTFAIAGDARGVGDNVRMDVTSGSLDALGGGQILIDSNLAKDEDYRVGSTIKATVGTQRAATLTVGGVYEPNQALGSGVLIPQALYDRSVPAAQRGAFSVYVKVAAGSDLGAVRQRLVDVVKPFLVVSVQDGQEFVDAQAAQVNQLLYLIYALLALSVVIAVLGIVNTLALSVFERTREIGLLRAVGMTRRQLAAMITMESVTTAVFGAVLGAVLGLGIGVAVQRGLVSQGLEVLDIPWLQLVLVLVFAGIAGVVAAILPAWRAVRLDVLRAITTE